MTKRPYIGKGYRAKEPLELIYSDLCGPMNVKAKGGFKYFISSIDEYSRYGYLCLMKHKSEALEKFKEYKAEVENLLIETAVHILNNVPSKSVSETPFELWRGRKPSLSHFRIWGCPAHVLVTNPKKLEPRSRLCQFVGYPKETRGGLFFDPQESRVFVSANATFLEEDHMRDHKPRSKLVLNEATNESTRVVDEVVIPDDGVEDPLSYKQAMNDVDKDVNGSIREREIQLGSIFMSQPEGFITQGQEQKVCKLNRSIYGLKKASRSWNNRFDTAIKSYNCDQNKGKVAFLVLYVDNILLIGNDVGYLTDVKAWLAA
ncbi:gag/pol protein [Cucumis melo var. makuwa]|uniref:Gag/pol protein n=1 Tax=Cucumis melo var. makuwa TaxID=1194695 RepID=A0A5D3CLD9_CUCMM|nr:gag/pol protein [Cucumis melo var. makuwa]